MPSLNLFSLILILILFFFFGNLMAAAAAEARAVWQRTANRYFVQEDAKRAPKLACRPSTSSSSSKQAEIKPANNTTTDRNERFLLPNEKSLYSDLSPDSRWWLQLQTDYIYQRGLTNSHQFVENQDGSSSSSSINSLSNESFELVDINKDSKLQHWVGIEKNGEVSLPWWQIVGKDDSGSVVSKRSHSHDCVENRHLPGLMPEKMIKEKPNPVSDSNRGIILEALRHSQTRAREAENAAKEAYAEKEDLVKVVLRQASELLACRQWIRLLQLENLYYQIKNKKMNDPKLSVCPSKNGKLQKKKMKKGKRRSRRYEDDLGKYAVVFAMGLGLVGAGLLLGWTVGWMLI
uniref:GTD-binding domain-containing protein n=2 Tax=Lactuca sativa TaxID=4236 RepID=A0A9R1XG86_LACSA|nr:hypothetical protein LSAT_V11C400170010 [Lactuca sativa]